MLLPQPPRESEVETRTKEAAMAVVQSDQAQRTTMGAASYTAAVVHDFAEPLVIEQVPARTLEPSRPEL